MSFFSKLWQCNGCKPEGDDAELVLSQAAVSRPVVIASPAYEAMGSRLRKILGCEDFSESAGPTVSIEKFKSNDPNVRFNWARLNGRKVIFLFDSTDQSRFFEQLMLLQSLQGFPLPDGNDSSHKWKTYTQSGKYAWGRASEIMVVLPWYRPCQMERTSRWQLKDGTWSNSDPKGEWLDVPAAQYMARILATQGPMPPEMAPHSSLDDFPLHPLWRPKLELIFVELHEELPVISAVRDLPVIVRTERFVPYFLDYFKDKPEYPGKDRMYIVFPDRGAYDRYSAAVRQNLELDMNHILYIPKTRVGDEIKQEKRFVYLEKESEHEKSGFSDKDSVLVIDDFTNSGSTLLGATGLVQTKSLASNTPQLSIFVSHLVAAYDAKVVEKLKHNLHELPFKCDFYTTNTIPQMTELLKDEFNIYVLDISDFLANIL